MEDVLVRGVSINKNEAKITIADVPDRPGTAGQIFRALAKAGVNVDMIIQNVSRVHNHKAADDKSALPVPGSRKNQATDISFTVHSDDCDEAIKALGNVRPRLAPKNISSDRSVAKISAVGIGMRSHSGVAAEMFEVLGKNRINIDMISTSEIKISCIINKTDGEKAVRLLHKHFIKQR